MLTRSIQRSYFWTTFLQVIRSQIAEILKCLISCEENLKIIYPSLRSYFLPRKKRFKWLVWEIWSLQYSILSDKIKLPTEFRLVFLHVRALASLYRVSFLAPCQPLQDLTPRYRSSCVIIITACEMSCVRCLPDSCFRNVHGSATVYWTWKYEDQVFCWWFF